MIILLKKLLTENSEGRFRAHSWLSPHGNFIPLQSMDHHGVARILSRGEEDRKNPIMALWRRGYQRLIYDGDKLYTHNEMSPPNDVQKRNLIQLAKEEGFSEIFWDYGDDSKLLWSAHDVLEIHCT